MGLPAPLDAALKRLSGALDQLEAATERLGRSDAERRELEEVLAVMQNDRAQLAEDLDAALARAETLEKATGDVSARLASAGTTLRRLLVSGGAE
jgi:chromosome segregation ATPase